jgi:hypothetical protein
MEDPVRLAEADAAEDYRLGLEGSPGYRNR